EAGLEEVVLAVLQENRLERNLGRVPGGEQVLGERKVLDRTAVPRAGDMSRPTRRGEAAGQERADGPGRVSPQPLAPRARLGGAAAQEEAVEGEPDPARRLRFDEPAPLHVF